MVKRVREQLAKYGGQISRVPAISQNLLQIVRILKDEDKNENLLRRKREAEGDARLTVQG